MVDGMPIFNVNNKICKNCEVCIKSKMNRLPFVSSNTKKIKKTVRNDT